MSRLTRRRLTRPPRVLPLLAIGWLGTFVAAQALGLIVALFQLTRHHAGDDIGTVNVLATAAAEVLLLVLSSALLRLAVHAWVVRQPADPPDEALARRHRRSR
jgi:hypothetical protein